MERRRRPRYHLIAPVEFEWREDGIIHRSSGVTRDIARDGIFVYSDQAPPVTSDVSLKVSFRPDGGQESDVFLSARAVVTRLEELGNSAQAKGFAVFNRSYKLHKT